MKKTIQTSPVALLPIIIAYMLIELNQFSVELNILVISCGFYIGTISFAVFNIYQESKLSRLSLI